MDGETEPRQILWHLKEEVCIDDDVEKTFWERMESLPQPNDPHEAWNKARDAIKEVPALTFMGR